MYITEFETAQKEPTNNELLKKIDLLESEIYKVLQSAKVTPKKVDFEFAGRAIEPQTPVNKTFEQYLIAGASAMIGAIVGGAFMAWSLV